MEAIIWIVFIAAILMYLEGCLLTTVVSSFLTPSKIGKVAIVFFWPISLPFICIKAYRKYGELVQNLLPLLVAGEKSQNS